MLDEGSFLPESIRPSTRLTPSASSAGPHLGLLWDPTAETLLLVLWGAMGLETWIGGWEPLWPAEDCANGEDDDHDGYSDCADPACEGQPCAGGTCVQRQCTP